VRSRSAFTLIEVMVALALSGIVLLAARALLEATADNASRITEAAAVVDGDANAERTMRALVGRLEVGTLPGTDFAGDSLTAHFTSWCDVPRGWQERCTVTLGFERDSTGPALVARTSVGDVLRLRDGFHGGALRYLNDPSAGGSWIHTWGTGITAPMAIGVMIDADTLIVRIGERG
jgi:prepilin-type N-terminal cleavage/methylation domain-containing protein